ncbi:hypothetical protein AB0A63_19490 [Lentzea sp. NPDC042327]|uniref:hypothetical protein n=1 Tax=Lentzea sp. NPDC042327 TaxID=3154801 RepID=UPI0033F06A53
MSLSASRSNLILLVFLAVVFAVSSTLVVISVVHIERTGLVVEGIEDGSVVPVSAMRNVSVSASDPSVLNEVEVLVDDTVVATRRVGERLVLNEVKLAEGDHVLVVRAPSPTSLSLTAEVAFEFTVDNTSEPWRAGLQVSTPAGGS